jgi:hypothetical protein
MKPLGYNELTRRYKLETLPDWCESWLAPRGERKTVVENNLVTEIYPPRYNPGDKLGDHLEFALKHEGVNLEILSSLFNVAPVMELSDFVKSQPTGKYTRLVWHLYEWLTGLKLPLNDLRQGNYIPVLDTSRYYALELSAAPKCRRQRVICNLPGTAAYCPFVRKTRRLLAFEKKKLDARARKIIGRYPESLIYRAAQYLYTKETRSSFEIERENPDKRRTTRFVDILKKAGDCAISKPDLVRLQKAIVEERFAEDDFRNSQNYVGETVSPTREIVHFAPPRPEDLPAMMEGWMKCTNDLLDSNLNPVVVAAIVGYGFVFLHPFEDGNGRLHRYLIHHVLTKRQFTPPGIVFPVSATMLKKIARYDDTLEHYSRELMRHVEYRIDGNGEMRVVNGTAQFYRYPDMTYQAEGLFEFIENTVNKELNAELEFLYVYDTAKKRLREIVDMPDRKLDLFIRACIQNKGKISAAKKKLFPMLTHDEIGRMADVVRKLAGTIRPSIFTTNKLLL